MKAVMLMFDSLNRHMLSPYGCDWVKTPNFQRLADRSVTFDTSYVGSMPCMPARRELHTGRYNFLHRSWGPLEPFDDSMPSLLKGNGVYTHLVSDHYHYWEDGGCTYHTRYSSWEAVRGQEGDPWKANLTDDVSCEINRGKRQPGNWLRSDWMNRHYMTEEKDYPQARTVAGALEFMRTNAGEDNWFLHIETFDPHEPYFVPQRFIDMYPHDYDGPPRDWPNYGRVTESEEEVRHLRCLNAALVTMCDEYLGRVLDAFDALDLWKDTMLIVNTDHGFLLGEHDCWAKCWCPFYEELSHTPLFIWDPRSAVRGERRKSLVQTIDLAPTLLEYFGVEVPKDVQGRPLRETIASDAPVREAGLFGIFGGQVNVTDGRYVYMRGAASDANGPLYQYTHMPTHMRGPFSVEEMRAMERAEPFSFTKGCPTMRIEGNTWSAMKCAFETELYDLQDDPHQAAPLDDPEQEARMTALLVQTLRDSDAPPEQYERLGL